MSVIDDELDLTYLFGQALKEIKAIKVFAFSDPKLAFEHFQMNHKYYQVIISDYRMPEMDGVTLVK